MKMRIARIGQSLVVPERRRLPAVRVRSFVSMTVLALVVGTAVSACGGSGASHSGTSHNAASAPASSASGNSGLASVESELNGLAKPVSFTAGGPAVNVGTKLRGKTAFLVGQLLEVPYQQELLRQMKKATEALGMHLEYGNSKGSAAEASALIQKAISLHVSVIFNDSYSPQALSQALKEAKQAGIPVVDITAEEAGFPSAEEKSLGIDAVSSYCYGCLGRYLADATAVASGGKGEVLLTGLKELPVGLIVQKAYEEEISKVCPGCKVTNRDVTVATIATEAGGVVSSYLLQHQGTTYIVPEFDAFVAAITPAISRASAQTRAHILTQAATQPPMELLQKGEFVDAEFGGSIGWLTWGAVDQAVRILTGQPAVESEKIPLRYLNASNIKSIDLKGPEGQWYGSVDFAGEYEKLWGLK